MTHCKIRADLLEPFEYRKGSVENFYAQIGFTKYSLIELLDPCGPTIIDNEIEALIVSEETIDAARSSIFYS